MQIALLKARGVHRRVLSPEEEVVRRFGQELFDLLLPNELRGLYRTSLNKAFAKNQGLRLKLRLNHTPELAALPWEFLFDQTGGEYICLSNDTPIVRYLELPQPPAPLSVTAPLRILGMVASPSDLDRLDVRREKERVNRALADLIERGLVEITWLEGETWRDLQREIRRGNYHIFHFIGHGGFSKQRQEGLVAFCNAKGETDRFTTTRLARLLANA